MQGRCLSQSGQVICPCLPGTPYGGFLFGHTPLTKRMGIRSLFFVLFFVCLFGNYVLLFFNVQHEFHTHRTSLTGKQCHKGELRKESNLCSWVGLHQVGTAEIGLLCAGSRLCECGHHHVGSS